MTDADRDLGKLGADVGHVTKQVAEMRQDFEVLKADVHDIKVSVAQLGGQVEALLKRQSPGEVAYAFMMFFAACAGLWYKITSDWVAAALILAGIVVLQRGRIDKLVERYFGSRRGEGPSAS